MVRKWRLLSPASPLSCDARRHHITRHICKEHARSIDGGCINGEHASIFFCCHFCVFSFFLWAAAQDRHTKRELRQQPPACAKGGWGEGERVLITSTLFSGRRNVPIHHISCPTFSNVYFFPHTPSQKSLFPSLPPPHNWGAPRTVLLVSQKRQRQGKRTRKKTRHAS
jgi:hypothetical protein